MTIKLDVSPFGTITDDQFFEFCSRHKDLRIERTAQGEVVVLPPTGGEAGRRNFELVARFGQWTSEHRDLGVAFDSSTGFRLPGGATRAPDLAWLRRERWEALSDEQRRKFPPLCPDFVVELLSSSDNLETTRAKMQEYLDGGLSLGWLVDPERRRVEIYRSDRPVQVLREPAWLEGDEVLPGFRLELDGIL